MIVGVTLTAATRVALTAFGLLTSIITARYLGQAGRGDYFFMITLCAVIVQLANVGLPASNTYLVARRAGRIGALLTNSVWVSLGVAGGIGALVALAAHASGMLQDTPASYLWLSAALAPPSLLYLLASNLLVGTERIHAYNAVEIGSRVLVLAGMIAAAVYGAGPGGFVAAAIVSWSAAALATAWLVVGRRPLSPRFDAAVFREGFRFATKAYVVTLLSFLVLRANIFVLRREFGPADLGLYSVAAQIGDVLAVLPQAVALVLFPRLLRQETGRWATTVRTAVVVGAVMIVACGVTALLAEPVISLLFGASFEPSARVLYWMLPAVLCLGVSGVFSQYLSAVGIPRPVIAVWAAGVGLVAVLSLVLIPDRGAAGAAVALSATAGAVLAAIVALGYRHHRTHGRDGSIGPPLPHDLEALPPGGE